MNSWRAYIQISFALQQEILNNALWGPKKGKQLLPEFWVEEIQYVQMAPLTA